MALVPVDGGGEELVASDCVALSDVENLCSLSRGKSALALGVDRKAGVPLWAGSSPQILA